MVAREHFLKVDQIGLYIHSKTPFSGAVDPETNLSKRSDSSSAVVCVGQGVLDDSQDKPSPSPLKPPELFHVNNLWMTKILEIMFSYPFDWLDPLCHPWTEARCRLAP